MSKTTPKPIATKPITPHAIDPAAQVRAGRDRLAELQREQAAIAGHIRVAILAEDGGRVSALSARQQMLPLLVSKAAEALLPLEEGALDAETAGIAAQEQAHRAVADQAEAACAAARETFFEAERRFKIAIIEFQTYAIRREEITRQRHALRARLERLATADEPLPAA